VRWSIATSIRTRSPIRCRRWDLFGLNTPEEFGGTEVDYVTFARIFTELARGWLGLAGIVGTHLVLCDVLVRYATDEQKRRFLPGLASGDRRGGICLSEPGAGTDLQNITTAATRDGDVYRINGSKMWVTNGRHGSTFLLLARTDLEAKPAHRGMSAFVIEKGAPGLIVSRDIDKLGVQDSRDVRTAFREFSGASREPDRRSGGAGICASYDGTRSGTDQRRGTWARDCAGGV
jgi:alkylation response protein AidB-like acyl-CoA dehydrogenase